MQTSQIRDWMTADPITAPPTMSLPEALQVMARHNIRRLPVVDNGKLVGIVTRGDLRGAQPSRATSLSVFELHYLVGRITLDQIMTRDPLTVEADTTVQDAARLMLQHKISGLPVMRQGKLVGIITESDIFRLVVRAWEAQPEPEAGR
ncbi:MAG: CBS domain-containing protein [Anaerolineales bacterium]|nr:CBS domain-containing protein [Anaerolineales bacterium]